MTRDLALPPARRAGDPARPGVFEDRHLDALENWLDSRFRLPVLGVRVGLDGIIGLVPVLGDVATAALSGAFIYDAWSAGASKRVIAKMAGNVIADLALGSVPVIGDLLDFAFKSNTRNLALLKAERRRLAEGG